MKLDPTRLYGFKTLDYAAWKRISSQSPSTELGFQAAKIGAKIGAKVGVKPVPFATSD